MICYTPVTFKTCSTVFIITKYHSKSKWYLIRVMSSASNWSITKVNRLSKGTSYRHSRFQKYSCSSNPLIEWWKWWQKNKWRRIIKFSKNLANWKVIPFYYFNKFGPELIIFNMSIDTIKSVNQFTNNLSDYYRNLLKSRITINKYTKIPSYCNFRTIRQESTVLGQKFFHTKRFNKNS